MCLLSLVTKKRAPLLSEWPFIAWTPAIRSEVGNQRSEAGGLRSDLDWSRNENPILVRLVSDL